MKKILGLKLDNILSGERTIYAIRTTLPFFIMGLFGYIFILIYASSFSSNFATIFGSSTLVVGSFLFSGALFGFLFGVPRTIRLEKNNNSNINNIENNSRVEANTNLEQISDWLTKILVGVGLTQLKPILHYTKTRIIDNLTPSFGSEINEANKTIANSTTIGAFIYFSSCGFFIGYLWSRVYLTQSLQDEYNFKKVQKEVDQAKILSSRIQLVRQIIDTIPEHQYNQGIDLAYLKSKTDKLKSYQIISDRVDKVLIKLKEHLSSDTSEFPKNLSEFLNDVYTDINKDDKFFFLRSTDYTKLGTIVFLKRDFKKSLKFFEKALEINGYYYEAHIFKGLSLWKLNYYDEAIKSFDKAIEINDKRSSALVNKCAVLVDKIRYQKLNDKQKKQMIDTGFKIVKKVIKIKPNLPVIYVNQGCLYSYLQAYDTTIKKEQELRCYEKALKIDQNYTISWYNKACYYSIEKDNKQSIECLEKAISLNEDMKEIAREDEDFKHIRDSEEFKKLVD